MSYYPNKPFSRDRLKLVSRDKAAYAAFAALDRLQQEEPEVAMAAASILFAAWCDRTNSDPHDMHEQGEKMLRAEAFHRKANIQLETIRDFAGIRIMGDRNITAIRDS